MDEYEKINPLALDSAPAVWSASDLNTSLTCDTRGAQKELVGTGSFVGHFPHTTPNPVFNIF